MTGRKNTLHSAFASSLDRIAQIYGHDALDAVEMLLNDSLGQPKHGNFPQWSSAVNSIADIASQHNQQNLQIKLTKPTVSIDYQQTETEQQQLRELLMQLRPWRKGPFQIGDTHIDTEWRSDWKWDRLQLEPGELSDQTVLDIGCGSGYHSWRILGEKAKLIIGIDPILLFAMQFSAIWQFIQSDRFCFLPVGIGQLPASLSQFDCIFSMGILYHRKSPIEHLQIIHDRLKPGGQIILETLIIDGSQKLLTPESRYARMRNVWFISSQDILVCWLKRCGFIDIMIIDVTQTTISEQRTTQWMNFESLAQCLKPDDSSRTVEGYPAPLRLTIKARRKL